MLWVYSKEPSQGHGSFGQPEQMSDQMDKKTFPVALLNIFSISAYTRRPTHATVKYILPKLRKAQS